MRIASFAAFVVANVLSLAACSSPAGNGETTEQKQETYSKAYTAAASSATGEATGVVSWSVEVGSDRMTVSGQSASGQNIVSWKVRQANEQQVYELRKGPRTARLGVDHEAHEMVIQENTFPDPTEIRETLDLLNGDLDQADRKSVPRADTPNLATRALSPTTRLTKDSCGRLVDPNAACSAELVALGDAWRNEAKECLGCWGYRSDALYPPWCWDCTLAHDNFLGKMQGVNRCKDDPNAARDFCE